MRIVACMFLSFWVMVAAAEVYKWTDANGKVHYSDKPRTKAKNNKKVEIRSTISEKDSTVARDRLNQKIDNQNRDEASRKRKASQAKTRAQEKSLQKGTSFSSSCGESKSKLSNLKNKVKRKYTIDKTTGERRWMGDREIDSEIAKHQSNVNKKCK